MTTERKDKRPADLVVWSRMSVLDDACKQLHELCRELQILGANVSVCVDGRVHVELLRSSFGGPGVHADIAHPDDPLPAPSEAIAIAAHHVKHP
jgi:hypothetical protein